MARISAKPGPGDLPPAGTPDATLGAPARPLPRATIRLHEEIGARLRILGAHLAARPPEVAGSDPGALEAAGRWLAAASSLAGLLDEATAAFPIAEVAEALGARFRGLQAAGEEEILAAACALEGLVEAYRATGSPAAIEAARALAAAMGNAALGEASAAAWIEPLVALAGVLPGDPGGGSALEIARRFAATGAPLSSRALSGRLEARLRAGAGLADLAIAVEEPAWIEAARGIAREASGAVWITGGLPERIEEGGRGDARGDPLASAAWARLQMALFRATGKAAHLDELERTAWNHLLLSLTDAGAAARGRSLAGGGGGSGAGKGGGELDGSRATPEIARALAAAARHLYAHSAGRLHMGLFLSSAVRFPFGEGEVSLTLSTGLPADGRSAWEIEAPEDWDPCLAIRVPGWAGVPGANGGSEGDEKAILVREDDRVIPARVEGGWLILRAPAPREGAASRTRRARLSVEFPVPTRTVRRDPGEAAVLHGPVVLGLSKRFNPAWTPAEGEVLDPASAERFGEVGGRWPLLRATVRTPGGGARTVLLSPVAFVGGTAPAGPAGPAARDGAPIAVEPYRVWLPIPRAVSVPAKPPGIPAAAAGARVAGLPTEAPAKEMAAVAAAGAGGAETAEAPSRPVPAKGEPAGMDLEARYRARKAARRDARLPGAPGAERAGRDDRRGGRDRRDEGRPPGARPAGLPGPLAPAGALPDAPPRPGGVAAEESSRRRGWGGRGDRGRDDGRDRRRGRPDAETVEERILVLGPGAPPKFAEPTDETRTALPPVSREEEPEPPEPGAEPGAETPEEPGPPSPPPGGADEEAGVLHGVEDAEWIEDIEGSEDEKESGRGASGEPEDLPPPRGGFG